MCSNQKNGKGINLKRSRVAQNLISAMVISAERNLIKTPDYSSWFSASNGKCVLTAANFWKGNRKMEPNGAHFSSVAPSSEGYKRGKE